MDHRWRLVDTSPASAAWNMACDEAVGEEVRAGADPVVRFFRWQPHAFSFGYSQRIANEIDVDRVRAAGLGLVRRQTGGRGVFHAEEITYSVICTQDDPVAEGGITATYTRISQGLVAGLRALGVDAVMARHADPSVPLRDREATVPCFGSTSRAEILVAGRKLVGSAQHRMRDLMLQHGSILMGPTHKEIVGFLKTGERARERYRSLLEASTISMREAGWSGSYEDASTALGAGLAKTLALEWTGGELSSREIERTEQLAEDKYGADWWNLPTD